MPTVSPLRPRRALRAPLTASLALGSVMSIVACSDAQESTALTTGAATSAAPLAPLRATVSKQSVQALPSDLAGASLVIKFQEGAGVGLRGSALEALRADPAALTARNLDATSVSRDLQQVAARLAQAKGRAGSPQLRALFGRLSIAKLAELKRDGEQRSGKRLADLSQYFEAPLDGQSPAQVSALLEQLNALDSVELAYVQPAPLPTDVETNAVLTSTTPDFSSQQGYMNSNSNGIGVSAARALPGGRGENVKIIDIEGRWTADHEDLPTPFFYSQATVSGDEGHGTGVAGIMVGQENGFGVTGISPLASIGYSTHIGVGVPSAFQSAIAELDAGDVLLLEMQFGGAPVTATCGTCNPGQCNSVPTEYYQAYFDYIQTATANGIIVVEAAGNGTVDLDDPAYESRFDRAHRDSGAIMVGGGLSTDRAPKCWTNHGSRVDVHAWGENVVSTGGSGDLYAGPLGTRDAYTDSFSGTSSASPIVAGAAALVQSIAIETQDAPLTPQALRTLLVSTGTPQTTDLARNIGPLPNLTQALVQFQTPSVCGDAVCEGSETCGTCAADCGACPVACGDAVCDASESCSTCAADCGACPPVCGDNVCDASESCSTCAADCGACPASCVPAGCESAATVTTPYVVDGVSDSCVFFMSANYVHSWSMDSVAVNGVNLTNTWTGVGSFPATCEGGYYLQHAGSVGWAHLELK